MAALTTFLMTIALSLPPTNLVLRSGERFDVDGPIRQEQGRVIFRVEGILYSIPLAEVDLDVTRAAENVSVVRGDERMRLKKSKEERARLVRELEQNHSGTTPSPRAAPPPSRERSETAQDNRDEWTWRRSARTYEDALRQSQEELQLLQDRVEKLRYEISGFLSLGYKPNQFSYQTTELQYAIDSIPRAELQVARARRALDQFRDDARRQGVLPGWLR